jgi:hypothetical protein
MSSSGSRPAAPSAWKNSPAGPHRTVRGDAVLLAGEIVLVAVPGRRVYRACTLLERHVIGQHAHRIALDEGMAENGAFQFASAHARQLAPLPPAALLRSDLDQRRSHQIDVAVGFDRRIIEIRMKGDGHIGGNGPRGGSPDQAPDLAAGQRGIQLRRVGDQSKAHPDGRAGVVLVLDLSLRQRRVAVDAPMHRLQAFVDVAAIQELDEGPRNGSLVLRAHGQIRIVPAPENAQALEVPPLHVDPILGVAAAFPTDFDRRHLRLARPQFAVHLDFNGQAVTIPAGHEGGVVARHGLGFDDEVLENLVERGSGVNRAVGVRRAVVQNIKRAAGASLADLFVEPLLFPASKHARLHFGEIRLHGKRSAGQVDSLLQVHAV